MLESRSIENDEVHARLVEAIQRPERAHLWVPADAIEFTPYVLPLVYGDGRALFTMATVNQRPAYWVIRGCSTWGCDMDRGDASGPNFGEFTDDILTDLEEAFGSGRCGYSGESLFFPKAERHCDCEECEDEYVASWPEVDGTGGCSWSRCDWLKGFETEKNPLSLEGNLFVTPTPAPRDDPAPEIAALRAENERLGKERDKLRSKIPARALTDQQLIEEMAILDARISIGFGEGGGSPGEWWYERADEVDHEQKTRVLEKQLEDHKRAAIDLQQGDAR